MKYKWAFHPEDYRLGENESFYSGMESRGWRLEKRGRALSRFVRSEPAESLYRLEMDSREPTEEQLALYRECGWEWVTKYGPVNVYRANAGSDVPELYTDAAGQIRSVRRLGVGYAVDLLLAVLFGAALAAAGVLTGGEMRALWAKAAHLLTVAPGVAAFYALWLLHALIWDVEGLISVGSIVRTLSRGGEPDHSPRVRYPWRKAVTAALLALCALSVVLQLCLHRREPMPEVSDGPYIVLSELGYDGVRRGLFDRDPDASVTRDWSPLCSSTETDEIVDAGNGNYVWLRQTVLDIRIPALARPYALSLIYKSAFEHDPEEYDVVPRPGWDTVMCGYRELYAVRGGRVVYLDVSLPGMYTESGLTREDTREVLLRILDLAGGRN